jgi:hypothetical protein
MLRPYKNNLAPFSWELVRSSRHYLMEGRALPELCPSFAIVPTGFFGTQVHTVMQDDAGLYAVLSCVYLLF